MGKFRLFLAALAVLLLVAAGAAWFAASRPEPATLPDAAMIEKFAAGAEAEMAAEYKEGHGPTPRDAHPKAHGCVKAAFQVDPALPEYLRVATFSQPGERFKAWIRFSNGAAEPGSDENPDFRGMAVKLIDADPDRKDSPRGGAPHDLLLVNYPAFFLKNLDDLRGLMRAGAFRAGAASLKPYFFPSLNPFTWRLREFAIAFRTATQKIESPLRADYFSMTPYAFGTGRAIKYSARPCAPPPAPALAPRDPDFLRKALHGELIAAPACFEIFAQERTGDLAIDDATQEWPPEQAPWRRLGRLELPAQDISTPGRDAICENMSFNPGHAPGALAPLGGINQARAVVYARIAAFRMGRNNAPPTDAEQAWDLN